MNTRTAKPESVVLLGSHVDLTCLRGPLGFFRVLNFLTEVTSVSQT